MAAGGPDWPGPPPPRQPLFTAPRGVTRLALVLLLAFVASRFGGVAPGSPAGLLAFDTRAFTGQFAGAGFDPWVWLALPGHALLHADFTHFLVNTLMLLAFGAPVERAFGVGAMVLVVVVSAAGGALALAALVGDTPAYLVGASDSVHGLAGLTAVLMLGGRLATRRSGAVLLAFLVAINLVLALVGGASGLFEFRIAWQAHLGGLAAALVLAPALLRRAARRGPLR